MPEILYALRGMVRYLNIFCLLMLLSNEVFGYFSIYVGGLLVKLSNANVGCHVGDVFFGGLACR